VLVVIDEIDGASGGGENVRLLLSFVTDDFAETLVLTDKWLYPEIGTTHI
jgi:hypothetical protein